VAGRGTSTLVVSVIAAVFSGLATVLAAYLTGKVRQVHVLVNSRLDQALDEISDLKNQRDKNG
jgi:hypothetical protein